jgi:membrane protease YdiL (CAAX protease family)
VACVFRMFHFGGSVTEVTPPRPDRPVPVGDAGPPSQKPSWRAIEAVPVFLLATIAAGIVGAAATALLPSRGAVFVTATVIGELSFAVMVVVWVRFVHHQSLTVLGAPREPGRDLVLGLGFGAALFGVSIVLLGVVAGLTALALGHSPPQPQQVPGYVRGSDLVFLAPIVILAAPIGEEFLFRGFLYQGLRRRWAPAPAAAISGVFFGLVHLNPTTARDLAGTALLVFPLAVLGAGLALLFERRRSILACIGAHAMFNLIGFAGIALSRR